MATSIYSNYIGYSAGQLAVGGVEVAASIIAAHGTPTYVYSLDNILESFRTIRDAYQRYHKDVSIHFSLKANANFSIVKALVKEGAGIDCVSAGEVFKALRCGCPADHIVFAGVGKTRDELEFAIGQGIGWFNVENELELQHLEEIANSPKVGHTIRIALRVNPDVTANTHPNIATGHGGAKFGLPVEVVHRILSEQSRYPHLSFEGIHLHIGSQLGDTIQTKKAIEIGLDLVKPFPNIKSLNIGGGMPVTYDGKAMPTPDDFAKALCPLLENYAVMLEPGRSIVASSGLLVVRVLYRKDQAGQRMLIVDGSMTDLMRPALYQAKHAVIPLDEVKEGEELHEFNIVGPVCETTDVLARNVRLPERCAQPGQLLALLTAGAYGSSMANNYNARPLAPQIVVEGGVVKVSTKRQTFDDLIRDELDK